MIVTLSIAGATSAAAYMAAMTWSPGPNNLMLASSGARFGYSRTLPHVLGILFGGFSIFFAMALGLGAIFQSYPIIQSVMKVAGSGYLLYLAWKIMTAPMPSADPDGRPMSFWAAASFQYVNPKVWVMGIGLIAGFLPSDGTLWLNALLLAGVSELVAFPGISLWAIAGQSIRRFLSTPKAWRVFNGTLGLMTGSCVLLILN